MILHIGIDDTDSTEKLCTTYLAAVLRDKLEGFCSILELKLVRLNPNIPWKTRGNGAVALSVETENPSKAVDLTLQIVEANSALDEMGTNPGAAFLKGPVMDELRDFYSRALQDIVEISEAEGLAEEQGIHIVRFNNGRGIIGALAAIGAELKDHTYELISYRRPENWGTNRLVDEASIVEMNRRTGPGTYNNIDPETGRIMITPRSPCPVLYGIRGTDISALMKAKELVVPGEPVDRWALFKTNQGTDAHLIQTTIKDAKPFTSVIVPGSVESQPEVLMGGHVVFTIEDRGETIDCAAYEPTGSFRDIVKQLRIGDRIRAYGGVRGEGMRTINLEKLEVIGLKCVVVQKNPRCPRCNRRMESSGKGQGYRCRRCKSVKQKKEALSVERTLKIGLYQVPPRAMRHLAKPIEWR